MEEILSSIRKIIADDEQSGGDDTAAVSAGVAEPEEAGVDMADDLDIAFDDLSDAVPETEEQVLEALRTVEDDADVFDTLDDFVEQPALEEIEDTFETLSEAEETFTESEPVEFAVADQVPEPASTPMEDEPMMTSASISGASTADAVAGSLGKLLSKVEFGEDAGGNNTIEGVVREMLRPMLKEWLDDNLPGIVEKQVEVEVQRIARMAR
ncbi:MAG: DUF2497 domain-containing protein [Henriciella sp.]|nr:DUF2497 domain-containing protein [Henriciella sp.]